MAQIEYFPSGDDIKYPVIEKNRISMASSGRTMIEDSLSFFIMDLLYLHCWHIIV
jgi:hypothetical protein